MRSFNNTIIAVIVAIVFACLSFPAWAAQPGDGEGNASGEARTSPQRDWGEHTYNRGESDFTVYGSYDIEGENDGTVEGRSFVYGESTGKTELGKYVGDGYTENLSYGTTYLEAVAERLEGEEGTLTIGAEGSLQNWSRIDGDGSEGYARHNTTLDEEYTTTGKKIEGSVYITGDSYAGKKDTADTQTRYSGFQTTLSSSYAGATAGVDGKTRSEAKKTSGGIESTANSSAELENATLPSGQYYRGFSESTSYANEGQNESIGWARSHSGIKRDNLD